MTIGRTPQPDLPRQRIERPVDVAAIQAIAARGHEHVRRHGTACPPSRASREIVGEHTTGRGVQGDEAGLSEFGASDREHTGPQIHVLELERPRLADPQARDAEEPEQTMVGPPP